MSLIIFSKIRQAVLTLLYLNEGKEFYVREIATLIHFSVSGTQRELVRLEQEGILESYQRGKLKLFRVNKKSPSFHELKSLIIKSMGLKDILQKKLATLPKIEKAFIYGSFAKKEVDTDSDIDLLIIGNPHYQKLNNILEGLEKMFGREINAEIISTQEFEKKLKIKDPYVVDIWDSPKIRLKGN